MDKRFAIFDMDGTLVDSMGYWKNLGREYLAKMGVTENVEDALRKTLMITLPEAAELFVNEFNLPVTAEEANNEMFEIMAEHYRKDVPVKEGVTEYLKKLKRDGVKMCVASNTGEALVDKCLTRLGIKQYFEFLLSCEEIGVGKSEPDVYIEAAKRLGGKPHETAVFEDAFFAARTAKNAGFYVVAIYDEPAKKKWDSLCGIADEVFPKGKWLC
ncbi:MAG: HAD family phosphatase [Ruminococcaceae bacterium]|nr:HAD family phosphatase [Oscillospiraceae bacterium]